MVYGTYNIHITGGGHIVGSNDWARDSRDPPNDSELWLKNVQRQLLLLKDPELMAIETSYNWLFQWDYTFYKWGYNGYKYL